MHKLKRIDLILLTFATGILLRLLSGLQGIDAIDAGFSMTFFQHIFDRPDAMPFYFCYYLTGLLGGCWQWLLGSWGLIGFRLLEVFTMSAAVILMYLSFKPWLPSKDVAALAVFLSFLFPSFVITFHYNTLTFLLIAASVYSYARWAQDGRWPWLAASGLLVGVCFFARIVNISFAALCLLPFLQESRASLRRGLTCGLLYTGGVMAGIAAVVALLYVTGGCPYFAEGVSDAFGFLHGGETSHTSGNLLVVYLKSWLNVGLQMLALAVIFFLYVKAGGYAGRKGSVLRFLLLAGLAVLVVTSLPYLSVFAACLLLLFVAVFRSAIPSALKVLLVYVMVAASLFPIGSDIGIPGVFHWYGGLMVIPAACCIPLFLKPEQQRFMRCMYVFVAVALLWKMLITPYGEKQPRHVLTAQALSGTLNAFTTPERARQYQHIVACISRYEQDNPYLLIGNQASELYYATNRLPFTGNTQMETFVGESLLRQLDRQRLHHGRLPLVVFLKQGHDECSPERYQASLSPWLRAHHYKVVYDDDDLKLFSTNPNNE